MRFSLISLAGLALAGCDKAPPPVPAPTTIADAWPSAEPSPTPNYVEHRKGVYYYAEAVSENDQKNGKAAGAVHGFRYRGKNSDGEMVLTVADIPGVKFTCTDPCKVIHGTNGQDMAFEPSSVIGGAFTDAMNGLLEVEKRK